MTYTKGTVRRPADTAALVTPMDSPDTRKIFPVFSFRLTVRKENGNEQ